MAYTNDINIAYNATLDQDISQEIGFLGEDDFKAKMEHEELMDQMAREYYGVCECCNGTGQYIECDPHKSRYVPCDNCFGTGNIKGKNE